MLIAFECPYEIRLVFHFGIVLNDVVLEISALGIRRCTLVFIKNIIIIITITVC